MELAMVGLGRMGLGMSRRLLAKGFRVVGYDRSSEALAALVAAGGERATDLKAAVQALAPPRLVWVMLPAGEPTESTLGSLAELAAKGDRIVDGGNAHYTDTLRRAQMLQKAGIELVDVGVSGGVWGEKEGYGLMAGGSAAALAQLQPVLEALAPAPDKGWVHAGPVGAGHFVKMVHNGIEYGLMQAYAEGFELLKRKSELNIDLAKVAEAWRFGTVIRSWLLDLTADALAHDAELAEVAPYVADSGEGRWSVLEAVNMGVPVPAMATALFERFTSHEQDSYAFKLMAVMRNAFGHHPIKKEK